MLTVLKLSFPFQNNKPLYSFEDNSDYVYDVMWSPTHPALFACVDGMGRLDLWNLNNDTEVSWEITEKSEIYWIICEISFIPRNVKVLCDCSFVTKKPNKLCPLYDTQHAVQSWREKRLCREHWAFLKLGSSPAPPVQAKSPWALGYVLILRLENRVAHCQSVLLTFLLNTLSAWIGLCIIRKH